MGLVDANYKFIYEDVGCNGRLSDGGVFRNSSLSRALEDNMLNVPNDQPVSAGSEPLPFVIVADDAFPLRTNLMKPYPFRNLSHNKRIFNYRLSRARRIVENAFGILAQRFRVFLSPIHVAPENVEKVTLASCVLHNYLREKSPLHYTPRGSFNNEDINTGRIIPGNWRTNDDAENLRSADIIGSNNYSQACKELRDRFCEHFNTIGKIPWQESFV